MTGTPPGLAPYVDAIWAYDTDLGGPGVHRGLPSTALTLVFATGEPLDCGWADTPGSRGRRWGTASGLHSRPAAIHHTGRQRGVQLALTTSGAQALLGVPASALAAEILDVDDVAPTLRHVPEQISGLPPRHAVPVVLRALAAALARHGDVRPRSDVGRALALLTRGAPVHRVADEVGYSRRRLSTLVREESGLTPKEYQRVARFEASRRRVGRRPLATIAAECGYADQAHLSRDWADLAGCPPSVWVREEFPFLQDTATVDPTS